jgi:hypothetical protein
VLQGRVKFPLGGQTPQGRTEKLSPIWTIPIGDSKGWMKESNKAVFTAIAFLPSEFIRGLFLKNKKGLKR